MMNKKLMVVATMCMSIATSTACLMILTVLFPPITNNIYLSVGVFFLIPFLSFIGFYWLLSSGKII
jgi:hypothetical protein